MTSLRPCTAYLIYGRSNRHKEKLKFCLIASAGYAFITDNKSPTGYDKGVTRCLLVTTERNRDGILVDCQGFNYAWYSAYVSDKRGLDLRDVPIDRCDLKLRQLPSQQER